jgi:hypothetical protein
MTAHMRLGFRWLLLGCPAAHSARGPKTPRWWLRSRRSCSAGWQMGRLAADEGLLLLLLLLLGPDQVRLVRSRAGQGRARPPCVSNAMLCAYIRTISSYDVVFRSNPTALADSAEAQGRQYCALLLSAACRRLTHRKLAPRTIPPPAAHHAQRSVHSRSCCNANQCHEQARQAPGLELPCRPLCGPARLWLRRARGVQRARSLCGACLMTCGCWTWGRMRQRLVLWRRGRPARKAAASHHRVFLAMRGARVRAQAVRVVWAWALAMTWLLQEALRTSRWGGTNCHQGVPNLCKKKQHSMGKSWD